jgi:hypothetical protein
MGSFLEEWVIKRTRAENCLLKPPRAQLLSIDSFENWPSKSINEWDVSEIPEKFRKRKFYFYFRGRIREWCACERGSIARNLMKKVLKHEKAMIVDGRSVMWRGRWTSPLDRSKLEPTKCFQMCKSWITCDWTIVNVTVSLYTTFPLHATLVVKLLSSLAA